MTALEDFDRRWQLPPLPGADRPIFLLSAGWRSGSTLLQRLVMSSGDALLWGEPYGRAGLIPSMTRSAICLREDWPAPHHFPSLDGVDLANSWVANLYPEPQALRDGFRAQLDTLLAAPARAKGFQRWGFKEVRLQGLDARLLQWLYPDARFILLIRNPWDAWSSAKGASFALHWPTRMVNSAETFARHWLSCVKSFAELDGEPFLILRYEDLTAPGFDFEGLRAHLGLSRIDPGVLGNRIRGMGKPPIPLDAGEIALIQRLTGAYAEALGYAPPMASLRAM